MVNKKLNVVQTGVPKTEHKGDVKGLIYKESPTKPKMVQSCQISKKCRNPPKLLKNCTICGKEFITNYKRKRTCCNSCSYKDALKSHNIDKRKQRIGEFEEYILNRDNYSCQDCGLSMEQSIVLYNRRLDVHHIDCKGRNIETPNNNSPNLITLCVRCHSRRHYFEQNKKEGGFYGKKQR